MGTGSPVDNVGIPLTNGSVISLLIDPITQSLAQVKTKPKVSSTVTPTTNGLNGHQEEESEETEREVEVKQKKLKKKKEERKRKQQAPKYTCRNLAVFFSSEPLNNASGADQGKGGDGVSNRLDHPIVGGKASAGGTGLRPTGGQGGEETSLFLLKGGEDAKIGNAQSYSIEFDAVQLMYSRAYKMYVARLVI